MCFLQNTLIKSIFCWRLLLLNEKAMCNAFTFFRSSSAGYEEYCEYAQTVSNSIYIVKTNGSSAEWGLDCPCFYPRPLYRTVYVKNIHWHSLYATELRSSAFGSAVNIWNWLASHLGRSGGKGHCQRDERERILFSFPLKMFLKRRIFKKAEIWVKTKLKSVRYSSEIHAYISMFLLSK